MNAVAHIPMNQSIHIDSFNQAKRHSLSYDRPAPDFFSGALLGNGGLGAVVCTRPDSVLIHFGHNNVWDIRIAEENAEKLGTFRDVFERVKAVAPNAESLSADPALREYFIMARENYAKPYPRPFPCGSLLLGVDRRRHEVLKHELDISNGVCRVFFKTPEGNGVLEIFIEQAADRLWARYVDENGSPATAPFNRIRLLPEAQGVATENERKPEDLPRWMAVETERNDSLGFHQALPFLAPPSVEAHPKDRAFRLVAQLNTPLTPGKRFTHYGTTKPFGELERQIEETNTFTLCAQLDEGLLCEIPAEASLLLEPNVSTYQSAVKQSEEEWSKYWRHSGVTLGDEYLERVWYRNSYFFACAIRPDTICPGLYANWSMKDIGSSWHGDYHMDYNTQQAYWACFSSNHIERHKPYVNLVHHFLPVARKWAREYYGLRGACFPLSAFPVEMNQNPYPVPSWGWQMCVTPWTVQGLWWQYLYTLDDEYLRQFAFEPIREAVLFLVDYISRPEAQSDGPWGKEDGHLHIFPTVVPELYSLRPAFQYNYDCLVDITLTKFVLSAYLEACRVLEVEQTECGLCEQVRNVLGHLPPYSTTQTSAGEVFITTPAENPDVIYNVPANLMTVFPGEEHGLHSPRSEYELALRTLRHHLTEGGTELVFLNLIAARLGELDLEKFKRQLEYCSLPNGTCTDRLHNAHGRYDDLTDYDFMTRMGVWIENFALPVVINECLLQSYNGVLRFFPNWPREKEASFQNLRAVGAFLVGSEMKNGAVQSIEVYSEKGAPLRLYNPWPQGARCIRQGKTEVLIGEKLEVKTHPGESLKFVQ